MGICQSDTREKHFITTLNQEVGNMKKMEKSGQLSMSNGNLEISKSESKTEKIQESDYMFRTNINIHELNKPNNDIDIVSNVANSQMIIKNATLMHLNLPDQNDQKASENNLRISSVKNITNHNYVERNEAKKSSNFIDNMPKRASIYHRRISQFLVTNNKTNQQSQNNILPGISQNIINEETQNLEEEEKDEQIKKNFSPLRLQTKVIADSAVSLKKSHTEDVSNISRYYMNNSIGIDSKMFQLAFDEVDRPYEDTLHVITVISNPCQNPRKVKLYEEFCQRMESYTNINLITVEVNYLGLPFILTQPYCEPYNIQFRIESPLNLKYNMLNYVISILPNDAEFIAWIDYNIEFLNENWIDSVFEKLKNPNNNFFKLYSDYLILNKDANIIASSTSGGNKNQKNHKNSFQASTLEKFSGTAWAAKKEFITSIGGFLDLCVTNESDLMISSCFEGKVEEILPPNFSEEFKQVLLEWQRCIKINNKSQEIDFFNNIIKKYLLEEIIESPLKQNRNSVNSSNRKSSSKSKLDEPKKYSKYEGWDLMIDHHFNPLNDLYRDRRNLFILKRDKEKMYKSFKEYYLATNQSNI